MYMTYLFFLFFARGTVPKGMETSLVMQCLQIYIKNHREKGNNKPVLRLIKMNDKHKTRLGLSSSSRVVVHIKARTPAPPAGPKPLGVAPALTSTPRSMIIHI
jgi:hypothetical protein